MTPYVISVWIVFAIILIIIVRKILKDRNVGKVKNISNESLEQIKKKWLDKKAHTHETKCEKCYEEVVILIEELDRITRIKDKLTDHYINKLKGKSVDDK